MRHIERDGVLNHQPLDCLLNCLFRRRSKKTSKHRVTGLCAGNPPVSGGSPHKGPVTRKMLPFDDVIMQSLYIEHGMLLRKCWRLHHYALQWHINVQINKLCKIHVDLCCSSWHAAVLNYNYVLIFGNLTDGTKIYLLIVERIFFVFVIFKRSWKIAMNFNIPTYLLWAVILELISKFDSYYNDCWGLLLISILEMTGNRGNGLLIRQRLQNG